MQTGPLGEGLLRQPLPVSQFREAQSERDFEGPGHGGVTENLTNWLEPFQIPQPN